MPLTMLSWKGVSGEQNHDYDHNDKYLNIIGIISTAYSGAIVFFFHDLSALDRFMDVYATMQKSGLCPLFKRKLNILHSLSS